MKQRRSSAPCQKAGALKRRAPLLALVPLGTLVACSSGEHWAAEEDAEDDVGQLEQALYESGDMQSTARSALIDAYFMTLNDGDVYEYCGLIVRKSDRTFRASSPTTSLEQEFCRASVPLSGGEKVVGYYHSHTQASAPGASPRDKKEAALTGREYFVISTATFCAEQYSPAKGKTTPLGCPFP